MLVTSLCWWLYDSDRFEILVAELLCWRLFSLCWWFFQCIKSVTNIFNWSPTHLVSKIRHQHQCDHSTTPNFDCLSTKLCPSLIEVSKMRLSFLSVEPWHDLEATMFQSLRIKDSFSVTVVLVTSLCWWHYDGDWFEMLATFIVLLVIFSM